RDPVMAAGSIRSWVTDPVGLDSSRPVSRPDLDRVWTRDRGPGKQPLDPGRLGDRLADLGRLPGAVVDPDLDPRDPPVGCPGHPGQVHLTGRQVGATRGQVDPRL